MKCLREKWGHQRTQMLTSSHGFTLKKEIIGREFQNALHLIVNVDNIYTEIWVVSYLYHLFFVCLLFKCILAGVSTFYFAVEKINIILISNKICYFPKSNRNGVINLIIKCKFYCFISFAFLQETCVWVGQSSDFSRSVPIMLIFC